MKRKGVSMSSVEQALKRFIQTTKKFPRSSPVIKTGEFHYRSDFSTLEISKEIQLSPELEYWNIFIKNAK
ncbi:hypothetical protein [Lysinibacillus sp. G4S2]|uniref:hypothetical protein n=1 Tax=Lysinibacillus sp. G4S2 TaxID=3055859 RepID=UPI0025A28645|nr:hypothetical protein [Lysinibacillus sp. G4S2]